MGRQQGACHKPHTRSHCCCCHTQAHDHKLTVTAELLLPPEQPSAAADAAAATEAAEPDGRSGTHSCAQAPTCTEQNSSSSQLPCPFVKLTLGLPESMIQHSCWKRSPAAAILFKQLFQCDNPLGTLWPTVAACPQFAAQAADRMPQAQAHNHTHTHACKPVSACDVQGLTVAAVRWQQHLLVWCASSDPSRTAA